MRDRPGGGRRSPPRDSGGGCDGAADGGKVDGSCVASGLAARDSKGRFKGVSYSVGKGLKGTAASAILASISGEEALVAMEEVGSGDPNALSMELEVEALPAVEDDLAMGDISGQQIAALENARKITIERIVWVQNRYRGIQTRRHFQKLKKGAIILQSCIRGYLARKAFFILKSNGMIKFYHDNINGVAHKNLQERYITGYPQVQALALAESRALQAEAFLKQKEDQCAALREKLQLSEIRCYEIDIKMKLKEEMWQKEMTSLQLSLAAAKTTQPCGRPNASPVHHNYDSEDGLSTTMHTPAATPPRQPPGSAGALARGYDGGRDTVAHLAKEFEQQIQVFEDDVRLIGQLKPEDELQNLKVRFYAWKKDYKARLRETKAALRKAGLSQGDKTRKKWWVKRAIRI